MKAGNTEKIREALKNSRTPKTCRELMEQAGMKAEDYKFAASILVGFTDRDRVMVAGVRECKVSGREAKVYEWERDTKKKAPKKAAAKKAAKKPAPQAPAPKAPAAPAPAPAQEKSNKKAAPKAAKKAPVNKPAAAADVAASA